MTSQPRKILVKEVNWLGDLVISLPALRGLRRGFPDASLSVLVKRELAGFFDGIDWISEVMPYQVRHGMRGWRDQWEIASRIRARQFDLAVLFPNSFASALWMALAGVPRRSGYAADGRSLLLTDRLRRDATLIGKHQSYDWLALAGGVIGAVPREDDAGFDVPLEVAEANRDRMREWLRRKRRRPAAPLIAIAPAAAYGPAKEWPLAYYAGLMESIGARYGAECVLIGAPNERVRCASIAGSVQAPAIVAAGETSIGELMGLLSLCSGFAGNDSGAMHLAAAIGIPAVGIFGSTNPARTGPRGAHASVIHHKLGCSPCLARTCRYGHYDCLRGIEVGEVVAALERAGAFKGS
jgi:heptosyltransferase II